MALGTYGTKRIADVSPEDVEIIKLYTPSRDVTNDYQLKTLNPTSVLEPFYHNDSTNGNSGIEILGGLYNLKLPSSEFGERGIYTLQIRPAQIRTTITDCGVLSALPNVKGIVIDISNVPDQFRSKFVKQGLVGYRVEYLNTDGTKTQNFFRIITSSFYCEPVISNLTNTSQKSIRYRYVESGSNLMFCTLSPSSSPSNKPNATPFIGQPNQNIIITNTNFNPITIDVEIAEHDIDTLAIALYGNQTKSIEDGVYTLYNKDLNIYKQYNLYEIRDEFNNLLFEVRQNREDNIDFSKNFTNITE
jgi:hypothetical protein